MHGHQFIEKILENHKFNKGTIIEIGSERGLGSTTFIAKLANAHKLHFITVDIMEDIQKNSEKILKKINKNFKSVCMKGEDFLNIFPRKDIVAIYLDAFDITYPNKKFREDRAIKYKEKGLVYTNEASWQMHLECCKNVYNKVVKGGFIVFDDSWVAKDENGNKYYDGKGKTAIPFLLNNGYKIYKQISYVTILINGEK